MNLFHDPMTLESGLSPKEGLNFQARHVWKLNPRTNGLLIPHICIYIISSTSDKHLAVEFISSVIDANANFFVRKHIYKTTMNHIGQTTKNNCFFTSSNHLHLYISTFNTSYCVIALHPWRLTWTIIMELWNIIFLSEWVICRFHVDLPWCTLSTNNNSSSWSGSKFSGIRSRCASCVSVPFPSQNSLCKFLDFSRCQNTRNIGGANLLFFLGGWSFQIQWTSPSCHGFCHGFSHVFSRETAFQVCLFQACIGRKKMLHDIQTTRSSTDA